MRRISALGAIAGGAWIALQGLSAAHRAGVAIPRPSLVAAGAVAAGLAIVAAVRTAAAAWRGPHIPPLPQHDVTVCDPGHAEAIRAAAALRGTMGGAGHVRPLRLALPAASWSAAAAAALAGPEIADVQQWAALAGVLAAASVVLPAKEFFYREATGGRVVLHPASARDELLRSPRTRAALRGLPRGP